MRVLFQARRDIFAKRGGDTIQFEATRKYLQRLGVKVDIDLSCSVDCQAYHIVHLFNLTVPLDTSLQVRNAKKHNRPVCLSTIYWDGGIAVTSGAYRGSKLARLRNRAMRNLQKIVSGSFRKLKADVLGHLPSSLYKIQARIVQAADVLLPNSKMEADLVRDRFPASAAKQTHVVYNGIDLENCYDWADNSSHRTWGAKQRIGDFVLCVGRIEPRKNQLALVSAMRQTEIPVVLVGSYYNEEYFTAVRKRMKPQDVYVKEVSHSDLMPIYASARVHALPSFFETPGLSSLESAAAGANVVTTDIGSQTEYFGDLVDYCSPHSEDSIREAIGKAWNRSWPNQLIAAVVRRNYTWEVAAKQTLVAYEQMVR